MTWPVGTRVESVSDLAIFERGERLQSIKKGHYGTVVDKSDYPVRNRFSGCDCIVRPDGMSAAPTFSRLWKKLDGNDQVEYDWRELTKEKEEVT